MHYEQLEGVLAGLQADVGGVAEGWEARRLGGGDDGGWGLWVQVLEEQLEECEELLDDAVEAAGD